MMGGLVSTIANSPPQSSIGLDDESVSHDRGSVTRFVVQLEYLVDGEWKEVVRFDHDLDGNFGHNVTRDGVHMDVFSGGEKIRSVEVFPSMNSTDALTFAEEHLNQYGKRYIERFKAWLKMRNK